VAYEPLGQLDGVVLPAVVRVNLEHVGDEQTLDRRSIFFSRVAVSLVLPMPPLVGEAPTHFPSHNTNNGVGSTILNICRAFPLK